MFCVESVITVADLTIRTAEPKRPINTALMAGIGAVAGIGARYIMPTKSELSAIRHSEAVDKFVSSASASARANGRSILKFSAVGAIVAAGGAMILNALKPAKKEETNEVHYSKYGALLDSSDYACQVMWYCD